MRRSYFYGVLSLAIVCLVLFFQNLDQLSQDETPTPLAFPKFLSNVYEEKTSNGYLRSQRDYERLLWNTPLYNQISNQLGGPSGGTLQPCKADQKVGCLPAPNPIDENWRLKFDPLKTLATVYMFDSWQGQFRYTGATTQFLLKKQMSRAAEFKFSVDPSAQGGNLSLDFKW